MWPPARCSPRWSAIATREGGPPGRWRAAPGSWGATPSPPYARYRQATHALCNAHLLRELIAVVDSHTAHPPPSSGAVPGGWCWAAQIIDALLALKTVTDTGTLPDPEVLAASRRLIVSAALVGAWTE